MTMDTKQKVSLGCGTLILIALIVLIFANIATHDLSDEMKEIRAKIGNLESVIVDQTKEIQELKVSIDGLRQELHQAPALQAKD